MADADSARTLYYNLTEASMLAAGQKRERNTIVMVSHCRPSCICCMVITTVNPLSCMAMETPPEASTPPLPRTYTPWF